MLFRHSPIKFWNPGKTASLQWHLTSKCEGDCSFCYMKDSPNYQNELKNELDLEQCLKIVDDFSSYLQKKRLVGNAFLTGGDPLLREGSREIMQALKDRGISVIILGNPHLIWDETAKNLAKLGIRHYQLSIDGTEKTHDAIRGEGSFKRTWKAVDTLKKNGISVGISYTLTSLNYQEIEAVIDYCKEHGVNAIRPSRLVPEGRGKNFLKDIIAPLQYEETLRLIILKLSDLIKNYNMYIDFPSCDGLRYVSLAQCQPNSPPAYLNFRMSAVKGCGSGLVTILPDGTMYVCRRLPIKIGNVTDTSLEEAFNSPLALKLKNPNSFKECRDCRYLDSCRGGCPSITHALTGNPFGKDPQCWLNLSNRKS